jgi:predicted Zn-dependent protease
MLGSLLMRINPIRPDEATAFFRAALALRPGHAAIHLNLAIALATQGKLSDALAECREAIRLKPDDPATHYQLARIYGVLGAKDQDAQHREEHAKLALAALRQAIVLGFQDANRMKSDDDLKGLRQREDFKKLVADLEKNAP